MKFFSEWFSKQTEKTESRLKPQRISTVDRVVYKAIEKFPMKLGEDFFTDKHARKLHCGDLELRQPKGSTGFAVSWKGEYIGIVRDTNLSILICNKAHALIDEREKENIPEEKRITAEDVLKELEEMV